MADHQGGFFKVHRRVWDHPIFKSEPRSEREAWIWMVSRAAFKKTQYRVGQKMVDVERGSFLISLRDFQHHMLWSSDKKVRGFLSRLENGRMVVLKVAGVGAAKKTHITICNYEIYQDGGRTTDAGVDALGTHSGRTRDAVKKEGKEGKEGKRVERNNSDLPQLFDQQKKKKPPPKQKPNPSDAIIKALSEVCSNDVAADFVKHRADIKKPVSELAVKRMVEKLNGHMNPDAVLNLSIENGWQGIFPEKVGNDGNGNSNFNGNGNSENERVRRIVTAAARGTSDQDWG